jgi:secondary thiamine-phosphate synthase enzyme
MAPQEKGTMTTVSAEREAGTLRFYHEAICLETEGTLQFVDLTDLLAALVRRSGVRSGFANIQTRHTTTAITVNENEPLLIEDMKGTLQKLAPSDAFYRHDDFEIRTVNLCPAEEKNGHAHCKGLFLKASETLNIVEGTIQLGQWQRIFFIELDRARKRTVSVVVIGQAE